MNRSDTCVTGELYIAIWKLESDSVHLENFIPSSVYQDLLFTKIFIWIYIVEVFSFCFWFYI